MEIGKWMTTVEIVRNCKLKKSIVQTVSNVLPAGSIPWIFNFNLNLKSVLQFHFATGINSFSPQREKGIYRLCTKWSSWTRSYFTRLHLLYLYISKNIVIYCDSKILSILLILMSPCDYVRVLCNAIENVDNSLEIWYNFRSNISILRWKCLKCWKRWTNTCVPSTANKKNLYLKKTK